MIVFLHIPKTAGSTFQFILENSLGLRACHTNHTKGEIFTQHDLNRARKFFPGLKSIAGHNLIDPLSLSVPDPFYMTFVREPVARVISHYQDGVLKGNIHQNFEESLRSDEAFENLHVKLMAGERNLDKAKQFLEKCHFVGLTEQFDRSLMVLEKLCPLKLNLRYVRRRFYKDNSIKKSIESDPRLIEMIKKRNHLDLELYSFAVNEIFTRLREKAGVNASDAVISFEQYKTERKLKYLACNFFNMVFYRQICKLLKPAPEMIEVAAQS